MLRNLVRSMESLTLKIDIQTLKDGLLRLEEYIKEVIDTPIEKRGITIEERYYG